jgi:D-glycero-D-manno-heptose 1,7-bisphosphate phosphatase
LSLRAVFLDRDGVINHNWFNPQTGEWESPIRPADFLLRGGVLEALAALAAHDFRLILVSNQPSAAKGKCALADIQAVHAKFLTELAAADIDFDDFCYAYAHPDTDDPQLLFGPLIERKPSPYFLNRAIARFDLNRNACWMVGDRDTDIECGRRARVRTIQVKSEESDREAGAGKPNFQAVNLSDAVRIIIDQFRTARSTAK